jgi:hypothetical protein
MFHRRRHTSPDAREKSPHEFLSDLIFIGFSLFFSGGDEKFEKRERDERKGEALEGWPAATPTVQYYSLFLQSRKSLNFLRSLCCVLVSHIRC